VSQSELKETCDLPKNTFYTNINTLIKKGYVDQTDGRSKFLRYVPEEERQ
jgi:DNA-binding IclR family transcriptional regulator